MTTSLLAIGQFALDLHAANNVVRRVKDLYYEAIRLHEAKEGRVSGGINQRDPKYAAVIAATASEYAGYQAAKRTAYNIQRRLDNACRRSMNGSLVQSAVQGPKLRLVKGVAPC